MADFEVNVIPKMDFEWEDPADGSVYRSSIVFSSWADMRNASKAERDAMIAEHIQQYLIDKTTPTQPDEQQGD